MEYRKLPHGREEISVIGLGTSSLAANGEKAGAQAVAYALENGVNYIDMASGEAGAFPAVGEGMAGSRKKVYLQVHFGADYTTGKYGWTTKLEDIKRSIHWQLEQLKTDYIDFGFIHCIDELVDWKSYVEGGALAYIKTLKEQGVVRHVGLSTHTPEVAGLVLDTGILDMLMFSINPGYDFERGGEFAIGSAGQRLELYRRCEREGVGISVMKSFSGGQLLAEKTSPFGRPLTRYQCIQYALDKPGVLTVLPGVRSKEDVQEILGFLKAPPQERDYSMIAGFTPANVDGTCVYCNHCQPCPAGIDVGLVNKYYDLAKAGDILAADHYRSLEKTASCCLHCGHCESRCPFHVKQETRMGEIAQYFGK